MDLLLHLSDGSPVQSISSHLWAAATMGDADDVVKAWVRLESGQLLDLEINTASAITLRSLPVNTPLSARQRSSGSLGAGGSSEDSVGSIAEED